MNAAVDDVALAEAPPMHQDWRRLALPLTLGVLLLGLVFQTEVSASIHTWIVSTAYNHCFLVIPIALYLLWDRRFDLVGIKPQPMPLAVLLGVPLAAVWLAAERLGIIEGRSVIAMTFVEVLFLAVLGKRLWWAISGPLLYLYFLVPFGEFLTPRLQDVTTWFIRQGVLILGIPAYIDGYIIEIPSGTFFVAEACAGLRFLIASIAFGCLYALMMYRSPVRRGIFILVSIVVPIVANGIRGLGIVWLGWVLDSAKAAAADHIIYGWVFFSIVILLLIALGLPFRQDEISTRSTRLGSGAATRPLSMRGGIAVALAVVVVAAISPAIAAGLNLATAKHVPVIASIDPGPGCTVQAATANGPDVKTETVICGGTAMDVTWEAFSPRITAGPVMAARRRMVIGAESEGLQENWAEPSDGKPSAWRIMRSNDPLFAIGVAMWVEGKPVRPGMAMRLRMAMDSLFGSTFAPIVVAVTPAVNWRSLGPAQVNQTMADLPAFLLLHPQFDRAIGALTAR